MDIKLNTVGKVIASKDEGEIGTYIKVLDDAKNTGGYIILISNNKNFTEGWNGWVEDADSLQGYFDEDDWVIEWQKD